MGPCERSEQGPWFQATFTPMSWHVYIIECKDGKLYTGITNNLERRIRDHNSGNGCRFTKYRIPVKLLHSEDCLTKSEALKREFKIKRQPREKKLELARNITRNTAKLMETAIKIHDSQLSSSRWWTFWMPVIGAFMGVLLAKIFIK